MAVKFDLIQSGSVYCSVGLWLVVKVAKLVHSNTVITGKSKIRLILASKVINQM